MDTKIVILHGWNQSKKDWVNIVSMFDGMAEVLEMPGFGDEKLVDENWGIEQYCSWVYDKLKNTTDKKIIIGHSFGGRVASLLTSKHPEIVEKLILYGAPCIYRPSIKVKIKIFLNKIKNILGIKRSLLTTNIELKEAFDKNMGNIFKKAVVFDQTEILKKIKVKTLLIWGQRDNAVPLNIAYEMKSLIPNSELIIIDKVGHNAHLENPYLFYGTIKKFI